MNMSELNAKVGAALARLAIKAKAVVADNKARKRAANRTLHVMALAAVMLVALSPDPAMAAAPWDGVATNILAIFTGGLTRTIAIIAVIACGLAALAGKLSWDWAIKIMVGIAFIFGAAAIVDYVIAAAS